MSGLEPAVVHEWMDKYGGQLQSVAQAFAEGSMEAEDILQRTWVTAWRQGARLEPDSHVGAWLHQITLNIGRSAYRKRVGRRKLFERWGWRAGPVEPPATLAEELYRLELWRAVAELPNLQRQVLIYRIVEDMSVSDTAAALDRAEGTVKASLHRALATLRRRLGPVPDAEWARGAS